MQNTLYYGDNLEVLRNKIRDETIDLCYIDPPFNSKRNYFQIYNNVGKEDHAQAQAFVDTWEWEDEAQDGYEQIITNEKGRFTCQTIELIKGLKNVLGEGGLLAYLVSMTLRIAEIHRVLKSTGSFYLHCDPTASHYLKLILDSVFCSKNGNFINEIIWGYRTGGAGKSYFSKKHDVILFYSKSSSYLFNQQKEKAYTKSKSRKPGTVNYGAGEAEFFQDKDGVFNLVNIRDIWEISYINSQSRERLGYPTQKPEGLLERIITASSNEGDIVLDAYCGCGTTIAVAERLKRRWIGIDITYQSISLILKRLSDKFGEQILQNIVLDGIPQDMASAEALAHKKDDRVRKEFEKWAVLTYSNNHAAINSKKGADKGIDGIAYFITGKDKTDKIIFQVKSGNVNRETIATLHGDMEREKAPIGILITLEEPTKPMHKEAEATGKYYHELSQRKLDRIQIVTVKDIIEGGKRLDMPMSVEVVKKAKIQEEEAEQQELF